MPSFTKIAVSSLVAFAYSANAAPILSGLGGTASGNANANANAHAGAKVNTNGIVAAGTTTDLKVFADAFLKVATGGRATSCDNVNLGLVTGLATNLKASLFSKLAVTQCIGSYSDAVACTEFGAYLAVSYYAYISGWTGATLFAALETTRVNRFHALLDGFCGAQGAPAGTCDDWLTQWNTFEYASAGIKADVQAAAANLQKSGLLTVCDTTAIVKAAANGKIIVNASANLAAHAAAVVKADANSKVGAVVHRGLALGGQGAGQANGVLGASLESLTGNKHHNDRIISNLVAGVGAAGHANGAAHLGGLIDRDLLDTAHIVGGAQGQGSAHGAGFLGITGDKLDLGLAGLGHGQSHGAGFLGVTGDKLGLGLAGEGKGKGFLGAVIA